MDHEKKTPPAVAEFAVVERAGLLARIEEQAREIELLQAWKSEELALMTPLMDYARAVCSGQLGCSITDWLVSDHKRLVAALTASAPDHIEQVLHMAPADSRVVPEGWANMDASFVVEHIRRTSVFDADMIEAMLNYAISSAAPAPGNEGGE